MSKGKAEIRQRLKNGVIESTNNDRVRIRRPKKKETHFSIDSYKNYFIGIILLILLVICSGYFAFQYYSYFKINLVRQPINLEKVISDNGSDKNLLWGTYRPQLYFGMKHRSPLSLLTGLMWFTQHEKQQLPNIRYWCNDADGLASYGWQLHDSRHVGSQVIVDSAQTLTTSFVKNDGNWMARIDVAAKSNVLTSLMWYLHLPDNVRGYVRPTIEHGRLVALHGSNVELGDFKMEFHHKLGTQVKVKHHNSFLVSHVPREDRILPTVEAGIGIGDSDRLLGLIGMAPLPRTLSENIWVFELTSEGNFTLDITFESSDTQLSPSDSFTPETFQHHYDKYAARFHDKFRSVFRIEAGETYSNKQVELAESAFSNLIGGIAHYHGSSLVQSEWSAPDDQPQLYWPATLFTATPARAQFPRGFLWDEGFHNLLINRWDPYLSLEIIGHWLDLINVEGWIPREQILGWEARAKVPQEFLIQRNKNGNPPTLVLSLEDMDERFDTLDPILQTDYKKFLSKSIPRLEAWYNWFNTTQLGKGFGIYQWKGRSLSNPGHVNPLTLTSGFDDYPRASHPSPDERHVDLRCWMAMFSRVLAKLRARINLSPEPYLGWSNVLSDERLLNDAHWDESNQMYTDYGLHTEAVSLIRPRPIEAQHSNQQTQQTQLDKIRQVNQPPQLSFIPHFGYVNLFPLLMKILSPNSAKLNKILTDLEQPNLLWTKFGLRSLTKNSSFYKQHNSEHDPPYWRGAIWINVNYLAIRSLTYYANLPGPYQKKARDVCSKLRANIVGNVLGQMKQSGYLWEQYDDVTGKGQRAHPFSGWTSLVVMSMANI